MSSIGNGKMFMELAKFTIYVTVPIVAVYAFGDPKNFEKFGVPNYVEYPPEGPKPHSPEEMREMARELARKRAAANKTPHQHT